jgi:hypothetical protein
LINQKRGLLGMTARIKIEDDQLLLLLRTGKAKAYYFFSEESTYGEEIEIINKEVY